MPANAALFAQSGPAFRVSGNAPSVVDFSLDPVLLSGWLLGGDRPKGTSALAVAPVGNGLVVFGFRPQYRAQSEAIFDFCLMPCWPAMNTRAISTRG